ncbi:MAG: c-type cytochrome, partial [Pyrinomonadaceae bacterium]
MNLKTIIAAAFLVASILIFTSNEAEAVAASNFETASSRKLYVQHCASCHGVNGKSQTPEGRELMADDLTTA